VSEAFTHSAGDRLKPLSFSPDGALSEPPYLVGRLRRWQESGSSKRQFQCHLPELVLAALVRAVKMLASQALRGPSSSAVDSDLGNGGPP
jgi:hypothetical protein